MKTIFQTLKTISEQVFDILMRNASMTEEATFNAEHFVEWNGDDASIEIYPNIDHPHDVKPLYRLFCTDGEKPHPVILWNYWCSNYTEPQSWIRSIWPAECEYRHFLEKFLHLRNTFSGDEAMNRFFRELSTDNQMKLIRYIETEYNY